VDQTQTPKCVLALKSRCTSSIADSTASPKGCFEQPFFCITVALGRPKGENEGIIRGASAPPLFDGSVARLAEVVLPRPRSRAAAHERNCSTRSTTLGVLGEIFQRPATFDAEPSPEQFRSVGAPRGIWVGSSTTSASLATEAAQTKRGSTGSPL